MTAQEIVAKQTKKISFRMGLIMNTINTLIFGTFGTLRSGHFTWKAWAIGCLIGFITGAIITTIVPPRKVQLWLLDKTQTREDSWKGKLMTSIATTLIIMPVMSIVMGISMPNLSAWNLNRQANKLEQSCIELQAKQDDLKSQQADLISQQKALIDKQSALKAEMETASEEDKTGMQNGINNMQKGIDKMQEGIDGMQEGIDGMQEGIEGKTGGVNTMRNNAKEIKSSIWSSLIINTIIMTLVGLVIGMITQPFLMPLVMKSVLGKNS